MANKFLKVLSSLKLTVVCLLFALVLVFIGTLGQVEHGLWDAQTKYFRSLFVFWHPGGGDFGIPVLPGGYLLGWVLLINLIAAHYTRFKFSWSKIGIFMTHGGLILLLLGQFATERLQSEGKMRLEEGQTKIFSDADRENEMAIIDKSDERADRVIAFPERLLKAGAELGHETLPISVRIVEYYRNSWPVFRPPATTTTPPQGDRGIANSFTFEEEPYTVRMDQDNIPSAIIEVVDSSDNVLGRWAVSRWATDDILYSWLEKAWAESPQVTPEMASGIVASLSADQTFEFEGKTYEVELRPRRYYEPYSLSLLEFNHDKYIGTDKPKNFSSRVILDDPASGENREVKIWMNHPLRYAGTTYFQASFEPGRDDVTILQVVKNPTWLTPYISVIIIGLGLTIHFMMHLARFANRRKRA